MRVAMAIGWAPREVRSHLTLRDIQELKAFSAIEPFGEERADLRVAYAAASLAAHISGGRHAVKDFMLDFDNMEFSEGAMRTRQQSTEEMQAIMKKALGQRVK